MNLSDITMLLLMVALFLLILLLLSIIAVCIKYYLFSKNAPIIAQQSHVTALRRVVKEERVTPSLALPMETTVARSEQVHFNQAPVPREQPRGPTNWDSNRRSYIK
jgi:hypothetical protein